MNFQLTKILEAYRRVFCTCQCGAVFRLSETQVVHGKIPPKYDWLELLDRQLMSFERRIDLAQERYQDQLRKVREEERKGAEDLASRMINKSFPDLGMLRLNSRDLRAIFRPVHFIAFRGLYEKAVSEVLLVDTPPQSKIQEKLQTSIEKTVQAGRVSWSTIRISQTGVATRK